MANSEVFVGSKFGKQGQLTVLTLKDSQSKFEISCAICSCDKELFPNTFKMNSSDLLRGRIPCGCSNVPKWSREQQIVRCRRVAESKNYRLNGIVGEWKANLTKLNLTCQDGHTWGTTDISHFLSGSSCPTCKEFLRSEKRRNPDEQQIELFTLTGKFNNGTLFERDIVTTKGNKKPYWHVTCPVCKEDEYTQAGLCTGVFRSLGTNLSKGKQPCRCTPTYTWTREQREFHVESLLNERSAEHVKFIGWKGGYTGAHSRLILECIEHGEWDTDLSSFITVKNRHCPCCATYGYDSSKDGFVYVLKVEGTTSEFTGFGITGDIETRFKEHSRNLAQRGYSIINATVFKTSGKIAQSIEREFKQSFTVTPQDVSGFRTEATLHANYNLLVAEFSKYQGEVHGG